MTNDERYQVERELVRQANREYRERLIASGHIRPGRLNTPVWIDRLPYLGVDDGQ